MSGAAWASPASAGPAAGRTGAPAQQGVRFVQGSCKLSRACTARTRAAAAAAAAAEISCPTCRSRAISVPAALSLAPSLGFVPLRCRGYPSASCNGTVARHDMHRARSSEAAPPRPPRRKHRQQCSSAPALAMHSVPHTEPRPRPYPPFGWHSTPRTCPNRILGSARNTKRKDWRINGMRRRGQRQYGAVARSRGGPAGTTSALPERLPERRPVIGAACCSPEQTTGAQSSWHPGTSCAAGEGQHTGRGSHETCRTGV